jgi:magnesium-transporting ATPase (P-type)
MSNVEKRALKERVEEISWASAVIVVIIYTIVESLMSDLAVVSPIKSRYMWGIQGGGSLLPFGAVFLPLIAYAILRILKYEPSPTYLAYLFTIGLMSSHALSYHSSIAPWNIQFADHRAFDEINLLDLW